MKKKYTQIQEFSCALDHGHDDDLAYPAEQADMWIDKRMEIEPDTEIKIVHANSFVRTVQYGLGLPKIPEEVLILVMEITEKVKDELEEEGLNV